MRPIELFHQVLGQVFTTNDIQFKSEIILEQKVPNDHSISHCTNPRSIHYSLRNEYQLS